MITLKTNQSKEMSFEIEVEGSSVQPEARLTLEQKDLSLSFPCQIRQGMITTTIPQMSKLLKECDDGIFNLKLEIFLEDSVYSPWEDNIKIEKEVVVTTKAPVVTESVAPKTTIKVAKPTIIEKKEEKKPVEEKPVIEESKVEEKPVVEKKKPTPSFKSSKEKLLSYL